MKDYMAELMLEKKIKKMTQEEPDNPELMVLIDKWFLITEKRIRPVRRFIEKFMERHLKQSDADFEEWLNK